MKYRAIATQKLERRKFADFVRKNGKKKFSGNSPCVSIRPGCVSGESHSGLVREKNEDSYVFQTNCGENRMMAAVSDGIGGLGNGSLASRICLQSLTVAWRNFSVHSHPTELYGMFLNNAVEQANSIIRERAVELHFEKYMGATVAVMLMVNGVVFTAHAGDSRIYRLRDGLFERLTRDHTVVEQMILSGALTREEAPHHPLAHVISRAVGINPLAEPEIQMFDLRPGDRFVLCSDGLYLHLSDQEIASVLGERSLPKQVVQTLLARTLQYGAEDNVTVVAAFA